MSTLRAISLNYCKNLINVNVPILHKSTSLFLKRKAVYVATTNISPANLNPRRNFTISSDGGNNSETLNLKTALVLTKLSRYEFEKKRKPELNDEQLQKSLAARGSDYQSLLHHHNVHKRCQELVVKTLEKYGIETKVVHRFDYNVELIDWANAVFTTGGDGTFLLGASRITNRGKPIIGINTDPTRSEGYLCLPKKYSTDFPEAMKRLLHGKFKWRWRNRIRITMTGQNVYETPIELHDQQLLYPEYRFMDCLQELHPATASVECSRNQNRNCQTRILPVLALNEVFVGETLSSRVSYYELKINDEKFEKQRSSGVTICTGTGSSSWSFNINKLTKHCVQHMLKLIKEETNTSIDEMDSSLASRVMNKFNNSLLFDPSVSKMAYTIRDPVVNGLTNISKPRGFARRMEIKSRCFDACLVIDGGLSFLFNDGALAVLEIHEEDALRTVEVLD